MQKAFPSLLLRPLTLALLFCCAPLLAQTATAPPAALSYKVLAQYPHDANTFTQGLEIADHSLFESSGLYNKSFITRSTVPTHAATTAPVDRQALPVRYFGEGLTIWKDKIYVATWREQRGLIFERASLQPVGEFPIAGEGWGLAHSGSYLILSNGSAVLQFLDPQTFAVQKTLTVQNAGIPVEQLNELEWIPATHEHPARLLANIWQSDELVVIDPGDGRVTGRLDLRQLYPRGLRSRRADVMNGIAFDASDQTLLVTGKFWPHLYRIQLLQPLP
jgi:glutamine cyclotransferase